MAGARSGEDAPHRRFGALYDKHHLRLVGFLRACGAQPDAVEDMVHEILLVAWRRIDEVPVGDDDARRWLFGVAKRLLANERRGGTRRRRLVSRLERDPQANVEVSPTSVEVVRFRLEAGEAWSKLTEEERWLLVSRGWEGLTTNEIARCLGCTPRAAQMRLSRARARLAQNFL